MKRTSLTIALLWLSLASPLRAVEPVRAELGKESAWMGEAVPLVVTLFSPGPFSGTASFDWPELPLTTIVSSGSPVVGSEQIDDESYFTQRHEFVVYTQRDGPIKIPPFTVRFAGKKSFLAEPEPITGSTRELSFLSRRPPGSPERRLVATATKMESQQVWSPQQMERIAAGDVIVRTITRRAGGTTAMMLPPLSLESLDGVRLHAVEPEVQDQAERGAALAMRTDTIKYQFERAGTFQLPDIALSWWDPQSERWQRSSLAGREVIVHEAQVAEQPSAPPSSARRPSPFFIVGGIVLALATLICTRRLVAAYRARRNEPIAMAAAQVATACRTNSTLNAYAAVLKWQRLALGDGGTETLCARLPCELAVEWEREWNQLARCSFGRGASGAAWSGANFAKIFQRVTRALHRRKSPRPTSSALPALNEAPSRFAPRTET